MVHYLMKKFVNKILSCLFTEIELFVYNLDKIQPPSSYVSKVENRYTSLSNYNLLNILKNKLLSKVNLNLPTTHKWFWMTNYFKGVAHT